MQTDRNMNRDNLPKPHSLSWQSCTSGEVFIWNFPKIAWHQNYPHHQWLLGCWMTLLCPTWQSSLHQADQRHQAWLQSAAALPSAPASAWPDSGSQLQKSKNILFAKHWHLDFNKEMKHRSKMCLEKDRIPVRSKTTKSFCQHPLSIVLFWGSSRKYC